MADAKSHIHYSEQALRIHSVHIPDDLTLLQELTTGDDITSDDIILA